MARRPYAGKVADRLKTSLDEVNSNVLPPKTSGKTV
jgi:hypothetical protein